MATFSKIVLSGSTDGRMIKVAATATAGTTIHTGSATATTFDEIWLYAVNSDTSSLKLTIEWGGVTAPDDLIEFTVPAESGLYLDRCLVLFLRVTQHRLLLRRFVRQRML
jgi:hypothetical protein